MNRVAPKPGSGDTTAKRRTAVIVGIQLLIALAHIIGGRRFLRGPLLTLYSSYFSDVVIPFGMYFLLCLDNLRVLWLGDWRVRAALVFGVASSLEVAQGFGVPLLGQTFDPLDFVMYGGGVLLAALVDRVLFDRLLRWWTPKTRAPSDATR